LSQQKIEIGFLKTGSSISCVQSSRKERTIAKFKSVLTTPHYSGVWHKVVFIDLNHQTEPGVQ
jgi:hypothetical protein